MPLPTVSSGDSGHVAYHNIIHALMPTGESVTVYTKAGTPVDGDFTSTPTNGTIAINSSTDRAWYRKAGTWTEITAMASSPTSLDQTSAGAAGDDIVKSKLTADTQYRYTQNADGQLEWGSGTAAVDTNLYRSAANVLKTDDALTVGGALTLPSATWHVDSDVAQRLYFASGSTTYIRGHSAAETLAVRGPTGNNIMTVAENVGGVELVGLTFGAAVDTNLYRSAADTLKTDDTFIVGVNESIKVEVANPADGETALLVRRNVGGAFSAQRVSMGATDSGGAGFKVLRVPN